MSNVLAGISKIAECSRDASVLSAAKVACEAFCSQEPAHCKTPRSREERWSNIVEACVALKSLYEAEFEARFFRHAHGQRRDQDLERDQDRKGTPAYASAEDELAITEAMHTVVSFHHLMTSVVFTLVAVKPRGRLVDATLIEKAAVLSLPPDVRRYVDLKTVLMLDAASVKFDIESRLFRDFAVRASSKDGLSTLPYTTAFCANSGDMLLGLSVCVVAAADEPEPARLLLALSTWMLLRNVYIMVGMEGLLRHHVARIQPGMHAVISMLVFGKRRLEPAALACSAVDWQLECPWCLCDLGVDNVRLMSCCVVGDAGPFHAVCRECAELLRIDHCVVCHQSAKPMTPEEMCGALYVQDAAHDKYDPYAPSRNDALYCACRMAKALADS